MTWRRALLKAVLYRLFGVVVVGAITWLVTGSHGQAGQVAVSYGLVATAVYVLYEKLWAYMK